MVNNRNLCVFSLVLLLFCACNSDSPRSVDPKDYSTTFYEHDPVESGFTFENNLDEENLKNPFNYNNVYNGGGVGIGDVNNDGLADIVMTGNMVDSKLYINKGNFVFEDQSKALGFDATGWATGVAMADINNDGWLDIYICRAYADDPEKRTNLLYLNDGKGAFVEQGKVLGVADNKYSIAASFLDYDRDGDLDLIVANHPRYRLIAQSKHIQYWKNPVPEFSSTLYRNDAGKYTDVTLSSGLLSYGFCLGVSTSDYDADGYPDIYLTVDHDEEDMVFNNKKDGTFEMVTKQALKQTSRSSMGIDAGDVNHDLYPDYVVVEMLPKEYYREKISMGMQTIEKFNYLIDSVGYQYYQMRNFLHLNNGNGTFSDVSQLAGIHKSDWSWASLFMDADNDSWQDLFFGNGFYRDIFNKDRMYTFNKKMEGLKGDMAAMNKLAKDFALESPIDKVTNFFYSNRGDLKFEDHSEKVGFHLETISNGAAYGDLDNDGDLDLVVNNLMQASFLMENQGQKGHWLKLKFDTKSKQNPMGAKVIIKYQDTQQIRELLTSRGYQGSSDPVVHFGLGNVTTIEEVKVIWPDGKMQILKDVLADQTLSISYKSAAGSYAAPAQNHIVKTIEAPSSGLDFVQEENPYFDYADQILIPHKMSEQGPFISKGDINNDGLDDLFIGAPTGQRSGLYLQTSDGRFTSKKDFAKDAFYEDGGSTFVDVDADGDQDLIVSSAGYQFDKNSPQYQPRLYKNDGAGNFKRDQKALPPHPYAGSCVRAADFDADGDMDIFIGGLLSPKRYPEPGSSALFVNDGTGSFSLFEDAAFAECGMVKDALWTDFNGDGNLDIIIVGEWMPISFYEQVKGSFIDRTDSYLKAETTGWWNTIAAADLDGNGLTDYVVGNLGLNYKYQASAEKPFSIYGKDIDDSGSYDIMLGAYYGDEVYPVRGKSCSTQQLPELKEKFNTYHEFSISNLETVYGDDLTNSIVYRAKQFASVILYQEEAGVFTVQELPRICQSAPINGIVLTDVNKDGKEDLIIAGNLYQSEIETGRADFGTGKIILNQGDRTWQPLAVHDSGLYLDGDVKSMLMIKRGAQKKTCLVVGNNKEALELVQIGK